MKFEPITIKDIAKALGFSTSTVSRALRGGYEISEETKRIVLEYAEKINYHPNPIALSLKERRTYSIGVVVSEIANNFFSQVINGIESIAYDAGYHVIITQSHELHKQEKLNVEHLASRSVDGLLISLASETNDVSYLKSLNQKGLPIVFFDRTTDEIDTHKVIANNFQGAFDATEYLIKNGKTKIAHLTNSPHLSITRQRLDGYKAALTKNGLVVNEQYIKYCEQGGQDYNEILAAVRELLTSENPPEAIFIASDKLTTGCLKALRTFSRKVVDGLSIAGFTNSNLVELFEFSLTTVRQPAFEMGQIATKLLIQLIESKRPLSEIDFETRTLQTELILKNQEIMA
ncbi:substrate-binding domain-containing protein [Pedobacter sp. HMF7647]|uniref:Substrate-binding domain-containing protein n=1 Tax=Hufsiella arboris TaxID=2695275 RepID=A0A7K1Y647_9SPHI|nr:LacI family DNA-binding transcriptional regulator [Hufsiella arboris]MXV49498.1 substrate-binding domain-containing protein [Hufsiella arboris]